MEHLLLIAGPSGSGKSTFIAMLYASRLPPEVRRLLPTGAERWPKTSADRSRRGLRAVRALENVILHYDIAGPARRRESYAKDPVLAGLASARQVTVVEIRAPADRLVNQFQSRSAAAEAKWSWWRKLWRRSVPQTLLHVAGPLGRIKVAKKPVLYSQPEWLKGCYARWDAFIGETLAARDGAVLIRIEPKPGPDGSPSFRLIERKEIRPAARVP
jgi:energy-coupling factor transporter ATP-binding protein EcfA2